VLEVGRSRHRQALISIFACNCGQIRQEQNDSSISFIKIGPSRYDGPFILASPLRPINQPGFGTLRPVSLVGTYAAGMSYENCIIAFWTSTRAGPRQMPPHAYPIRAERYQRSGE